MTHDSGPGADPARSARASGPDAREASPTDEIPLPSGPNPSILDLAKRCRADESADRLLAQAHRIIGQRSKDRRLREYARRALHVVLQGGCADIKTRTRAARRLTAYYNDMGACGAGRTVWRIYRRLFRQQFPSEPLPPYPDCKTR